MTKLEAMTEGGARLREIKVKLAEAAIVGSTPLEIDTLAEKLIREGGDKPSFAMVKGYSHATCINVNDGMVHGIPNETPFKEGDVVKIDVGLFHNGYHLDSAITVCIGKPSQETEKFIETGKKALQNAIFAARPGSSVYDISSAIQDTVEKAGYSAIRDLTGHGIGRELHMDPYIPCYREGSTKKNILFEGQTLAIEVMYAKGAYYLMEDTDGWTLRTQDGSITGMWEHTVFIDRDQTIILT